MFQGFESRGTELKDRLFAQHNIVNSPDHTTTPFNKDPDVCSGGDSEEQGKTRRKRDIPWLREGTLSVIRRKRSETLACADSRLSKATIH